MLTTAWGPVGTRGGCGAGWGPCACPGGNAIHWGSVRQDGRTPTRTSTRPPHPHYPAPCPYRTLGRKHLNGDDSPIRSSTFIRGLSEAKRSASQYSVPTADYVLSKIKMEYRRSSCSTQTDFILRIIF